METFGSMTGKNVSAKLSINLRRDATDNKKLDHNDSYLAVLLGNWSVSAEKINHWWGPANENALVLSNNAGPMSGVRLSRHNSDYYGPGWLSFVGPWQVSALYARQKPVAGLSDHAAFWGIRATSMPVPGLELGLSISDSEQMHFPESLEPQRTLSEYDENRIDESRISAVDFKYSTSAFTLPVAVYGEWAGHKGSQLVANHGSYTFGFESYFGNQDHLVKTYLEYSDTTNSCLQTDPTYNCNYGQPDLPGYVHRAQNIGPAVGQDVKSSALGLIYHALDGYGGYLKLRHLDFTQNTDSRVQLEVGYQQGLFKGLFKVAATLTRDKRDEETQNHQALKGSWEYRF